jgi:hypothetical protein
MEVLFCAGSQARPQCQNCKEIGEKIKPSCVQTFKLWSAKLRKARCDFDIELVGMNNKLYYER